MRLRTSLAAILIALASSTATAETLGDVLDKGAKRISAKEAVQVFLSGVLHGETSNGGLIEVIYKPDGIFTGSASEAPFSDATWRVDGDRFCADYWPCVALHRVSQCAAHQPGDDLDWLQVERSGAGVHSGNG